MNRIAFPSFCIQGHLMGYAVCADVLVTIHAAYVGYVVFGQLVILLGVALRWQWVRNFWFRITHLLAIAIVAGESILHIQCPLTVWENQLRQAAGQSVAEGSFVARWMHQLLFFQAEPWVFEVCYIAFALLVLLTFVLAPPRRLRLSGAH
jgi:hypothetical protein